MTKSSKLCSKILKCFKMMWNNLNSTKGIVDHESGNGMIRQHCNGKYYIVVEYRDMLFYGDEQIDTLEEAYAALHKYLEA